ncbi:hypothetical protein GCM10027300_07280 [Modestobacter lapidis]
MAACIRCARSGPGAGALVLAAFPAASPVVTAVIVPVVVPAVVSSGTVSPEVLPTRVVADAPVLPLGRSEEVSPGVSGMR